MTSTPRQVTFLWLLQSHIYHISLSLCIIDGLMKIKVKGHSARKFCLWSSNQLEILTFPWLRSQSVNLLIWKLRHASAVRVTRQVTLDDLLTFWAISIDKVMTMSILKHVTKGKLQTWISEHQCQMKPITFNIKGFQQFRSWSLWTLKGCSNITRTEEAPYFYVYTYCSIVEKI